MMGNLITRKMMKALPARDKAAGMGKDSNKIKFYGEQCL